MLTLFSWIKHQMRCEHRAQEKSAKRLTLYKFNEQEISTNDKMLMLTRMGVGVIYLLLGQCFQPPLLDALAKEVRRDVGSLVHGGDGI